jgi:lipopolysaccharide/colanic/teichoic acid biosynthesis glycosyltransferase
LALLFFQVPNELILSNIREYMKYHQFSEFRYFCDQKIPVTFQYGGTIAQFSDSFNNSPADELMVIGYPSKGEVSNELLLTLKLSGAIIKLIPIDLNLLSGLIQINNFRDLPHIRLFPNKITTTHQFLKELLTKASAIFGIILTGILMPFIALLIKTTSSGPVFYRQKRLGKNARPFTLYKFRTMGVSAEKNGPQLSGNEDQRITKAGRILRYWHIDELPQFWNLLKGDMALVGPRPERPFFARFLANKIPYYKIIYQQKPGLTSLGMIKYGYASSVEEMTDRLYYDIVYLNNPSFWMDIKILINTIRYIILKTFYDPSKDRNLKREGNIKTLTESHDPLIRWLSLKNKANG